MDTKLLDPAFGEVPCGDPWCRAVLVTQLLGSLALPSGEIVACDPFMTSVPVPLQRRVAPGSYPLLLAIARIDADQRVAFAKLRFSDRPVARWELALAEGEQSAALDEDEFAGYSVDSGTGSFMDHRTAERLLRRFEEDASSRERLAQRMDAGWAPTWSWIEVPAENDDANAFFFSSGYGDGVYASWFGLDGEGEPVCLVTDFQVLFEEADEI